MDDGDLRDLCNRFLDAVERGDLDAVAECYAPGFTFWANTPDAEQTREDNLKTLEWGKSVHRRRTYDDRSIQTFADGFVTQYSVNVVQQDGKKRSLWACIVARCRNGQITHIDEYIDSSKFSGAGRKVASS
jgi:ketosteroid isomerase-like protein